MSKKSVASIQLVDSAADDARQHLLRRVTSIERKVDSLDQIAGFTLRADRERHMKDLEERVFAGKRRAQVYMAVDGKRSVSEIAKAIGIDARHLSRELNVLREEGLVDIVAKAGTKTLWGKTEIERRLHLGRHLMKQHQLDKNGRAL